jgi:hypothetical protein
MDITDERVGIILIAIVILLGIIEFFYSTIFPFNIILSIIIFVIAAFMIRKEFFFEEEPIEEEFPVRSFEETKPINFKRKTELDRFIISGPKKPIARDSNSLKAELEKQGLSKTSLMLEEEKKRMIESSKQLLKEKALEKEKKTETTKNEYELEKKKLLERLKKSLEK